MSDLELLADTMQGYSITSGDHHMQAAAAIRELIKLQAAQAQAVNQQLLEALQPLRLDIFGDGLPNNLYHEPCEHGDFLYYDQVVAAIAAAQEQ